MKTPVAVITGASSGIGMEFARRLSEKGYECLLVARSEDKLNALRDSLPAASHVLALDLGCADSPARVLEWLDANAKEPVILINNAGFGAFGPMIEADEARLLNMIDLNVRSHTALAVAIARRMHASGSGRILNVASTAAFQPCPYMGVYGATKAYVLSFSEALAEELRRTAVSVTALCPGPTRTGFGTSAGLLEDSPFDRYAADTAQVVEAGLEALFSGRTVAVTGWLNLLGSLLSRFVPRAVVRRISGDMLRRMC
mgnify:FL=1